ncbi:hypothetical protein C8Q78DRAFT_1195110, partial [Trametes maxima]
MQREKRMWKRVGAIRTTRTASGMRTSRKSRRCRVFRVHVSLGSFTCISPTSQWAPIGSVLVYVAPFSDCIDDAVREGEHATVRQHCTLTSCRCPTSQARPDVCIYSD